jgi:pimeloyl-ACP methyl ester carboxylesterase
MTDTMRTEMITGHGGVRLAVHRLGAGRPALLLHGLSSSADMNYVRFGHAAQLAAAGFEAIMPDQRAHGQSDAPHDAAAWPRDVLAHDAAALIDALNLSSFDLVGYSLGARVALQLVLQGAAPRRLVLGGMGLEGLIHWQGRRDFFLGALDRYDVARPGDADYPAIRFMKSIKADPLALRLLLGTMSDFASAGLAHINVPTLVLSGVDDRDNGSAEALTAALPAARFAAIPGNHMNCITRPEFGAAIADFLAA